VPHGQPSSPRPQIRADESIGVMDVAGANTPGPRLGDVRDIVLAVNHW